MFSPSKSFWRENNDIASSCFEASFVRGIVLPFTCLARISALQWKRFHKNSVERLLAAFTLKTVKRERHLPFESLKILEFTVHPFTEFYADLTIPSICAIRSEKKAVAEHRGK